MTGTIIEFIILLMAHAAVGIYSSTLKFSKKVTYIIWVIWILFQSGLLFFTEYVLINHILQFFAGFIMSLVGQYLIFFLTTKGKVVQRIFTLLTYSIFFCISVTLLTMVKGTFPNLHPVQATFIHIAILFGIVFFFLRYVCPLCRSASKNITGGWFLLNFVNVVFLLAVILSSIFPARLDSFYDSACITFIFLSVSIMAVYPVVFFSINNMSDAAMKREVETQNKLLLAQIETETAQLEADSHARHDRRHHNLVMLEFANNNDIESVREYLQSLVEQDSEVWGEVRYCDNLTVNTVLTVYERRARENGISANIRANVVCDLPISPQDLVIVIANVFENAINEVSKLRNKEKYINITIKENMKRLVVIADNPCREKTAFDEGSYGVGIRSIISTVNKYEGMYDFSANGSLFSAKINLNLQ